jgi:hypothetical protein
MAHILPDGDTLTVPTGWLCPICRLVHSPSVETCPCRATGRSITSLPRPGGAVPCPAPREGGMCGCDEPQDSCPEGVCLSSECDCL